MIAKSYDFSMNRNGNQKKSEIRVRRKRGGDRQGGNEAEMQGDTEMRRRTGAEEELHLSSKQIPKKRKVPPSLSRLKRSTKSDVLDFLDFKNFWIPRFQNFRDFRI